MEDKTFTEEELKEYENPYYGSKCCTCRKPAVVPEWGDPLSHPCRVVAIVDKANPVQTIKGKHTRVTCMNCLFESCQ